MSHHDRGQEPDEAVRLERRRRRPVVRGPARAGHRASSGRTGRARARRCVAWSASTEPTAARPRSPAASYRQLAAPLHEVGVLLDAGYVHPGRSGRNHLRWLAASNGIAWSRVDEVLALVGHDRCRQPQAAQLLARHEAAARHRRHVARRPADDHPRRAGQRARPRGHPLDPRLPPALRRRRVGPCWSAATCCPRCR